MKKLRNLLLIAATLLMAVGCAKKYEISVTPNSHEFEYAGGVIEVKIATQGDWSVTSCPDWITPSMRTGSKDATLQLEAAANAGDAEREGIIEIATSTHSAQVAVKQGFSAGSFIMLSPATLDVPYQGGEYQVNVSANCSWTVTQVPAWVTVSATSGQGNHTLTFTVASYLDDTAPLRSASILFGGSESLTMLKITQTNASGTEVTVTPKSLRFEHAGGTQQVAVTCPVKWTASTLSDWITFDVAEGTGDAQVNLTAAANEAYTARLGSVVFTTETGFTASVNISQDAAPNPHYLTVDPTEISVSNEGGPQIVNVSSDGEWFVSNEADWLTVRPEQGQGDRELRFDIHPNLYIGERDAVVTIKSEYHTVQVKVKQESGTLVPIALLDPDTLSLPYEGGSTSFTVTSNMDWELRSTVDWITMRPLQGSGDGVVEITYTQNTMEHVRRGSIELLVNGEKKDEILVIQDRIEYVFSVDVTEIDIPAEGGKFSIQVTTNQQWSLTPQAGWIHPDTLAGEGSFSVGVEIDANLTPSDRESTITVKGQHEGVAVVTVRQLH